jgi:hypothetical protein
VVVRVRDAIVRVVVRVSVCVSVVVCSCDYARIKHVLQADLKILSCLLLFYLLKDKSGVEAEHNVINTDIEL